jgi:type I restriction enzyme S subunit
MVPLEPTRRGWRWHRLTKLARLATGHTPSRRCPEYWDGDIPWIQLPDIRALDGRLAMDTSEHTNALGIENSAAVLLPAGTVCLSRTASVGFVTIMGREMATSQDFVNWVCGPDLDPAFLMHLFIACRKPIRDLGSGAVHHTIYFPTVEQFAVCVPDLPTQRRIAAGLSAQLAAADEVIARCREELAAVEALPAALLRDVFGTSPIKETDP